MPILGSNMWKQVSPDTRPTIIGEEGVLHRLTDEADKADKADNGSDNEKTYFVKSWRGKHDLRGSSYKYGPENERSSVSPFWHKLQFYQHKLARLAVPDLIVPIVASHDPRISKNGQTFTWDTGRPITITPEVQTTDHLRAQHQALIYQSYTASREFVRTDADGQEQVTNPYAYLVKGSPDQDIQKAFGEYLGIRKFIRSVKGQSAEVNQRLREAVKDQFPGTDVERLVMAGIVPVHAELNYIPTQMHDQQKTRGIFLEIAIYDLPLLRQMAIQKQTRDVHNDAERAKIVKRVARACERFATLQTLDELWDNIYYFRQTENRNSLVYDDQMTNEVFELFQKLSSKLEQGYRMSSALRRQMYTLAGIMSLENTPESIVLAHETIQAIQASLD